LLQLLPHFFQEKGHFDSHCPLLEFMSSISPYLYRITFAKDWADAESNGFVARSPLDQKDGFYHFSTAQQVPGTLGRFFHGVDELILLQMRDDSFGADLRYEVAPPVPGNNLFPHLFREKLLLRDIQAALSVSWNDELKQHEFAPLPFRPVAMPSAFNHVLVSLDASHQLSHEVIQQVLRSALALVSPHGQIDVAIGSLPQKSLSLVRSNSDASLQKKLRFNFCRY
jgi:uncharacterized protein (DUF952 family)